MKDLELSSKIVELFGNFLSKDLLLEHLFKVLFVRLWDLMLNSRIAQKDKTGIFFFYRDCVFDKSGLLFYFMDLVTDF